MNVWHLFFTIRSLSVLFFLCSFIPASLLPLKADKVTYAASVLPDAQTRLAAALPSFPEQAHANEQKSLFTFNSHDLELLEQSSLLEAQLEKTGLTYDDEKLNKYVNQIGQTIVSRNPLPYRVRWKFWILRDSFANAFALPNGSIYVTTGLLALIENESQLAGVLAHEIKHVLERHTFLKYRSMRKKMLAIRLLNAAATWSPAFGAASTAIYFLASSVEAVLFVTMYGYGPEFEREADTYALKTLSELNYDS